MSNEADSKKSTELLETLKHADQLYDENHYQEAIDVLKKYPEIVPEIKWRLARAYFSLSKTVDKKERETCINEAFQYSKESLDENDKDFAAHKWFAVLLDAKSELTGTRERVNQMKTVKEHMIKAATLNPEDPTSWYLLGAFAFNVADLPWYQRKIVTTIFSTPFDETYDEALEHFLKAESLKANFYSMNKLMIGKCYLRLKNNEEAKQYLSSASNIKVVTVDDKKCKEEADQLLKKL
jgi:tetratricopeptide (TPR) repeat protein